MTPADTPVLDLQTPSSPPGELLHDHIETPVGRLELVAAPTGLRAVLWPGEDGSRVRRSLTRPGTAPEGAEDHASVTLGHLDAAARQLREYFEGSRTEFVLTLDPVGTAFQVRVWQELRAIPFGHTRTYAEQARAIGAPNAARAVGAADGRNPLSIVVPCHRVVGTTGRLTGFAGGMPAKAWLLHHEREILAARASTP